MLGLHWKFHPSFHTSKIRARIIIAKSILVLTCLPFIALGIVMIPDFVKDGNWGMLAFTLAVSGFIVFALVAYVQTPTKYLGTIPLYHPETDHDPANWWLEND